MAGADLSGWSVFSGSDSGLPYNEMVYCSQSNYYRLAIKLDNSASPRLSSLDFWATWIVCISQGTKLLYSCKSNLWFRIFLWTTKERPCTTSGHCDCVRCAFIFDLWWFTIGRGEERREEGFGMLLFQGCAVHLHGEGCCLPSHSFPHPYPPQKN